jgi:hypothetical protein
MSKPKVILVLSGKGPKNKFSLKELRIITCPECHMEFGTYSARTKYCSNSCQYKVGNRRNKANHKSWQRKHPDRMKKSKIESQDRLYAFWGKREYHHHTDPLVIQSEIFVANEVLPKHGFTDILLTREFSAFFPCDILCRKNTETYLVEVTLSAKRKINPRIVPLIKFFHAHFLVCHVRKDLSMYYITEPKPGILYVSCEHLVRQQMKVEAT